MMDNSFFGLAYEQGRSTVQGYAGELRYRRRLMHDHERSVYEHFAKKFPDNYLLEMIRSGGTTFEELIVDYNSLPEPDRKSLCELLGSEEFGFEELNRRAEILDTRFFKCGFLDAQ